MEPMDLHSKTKDELIDIINQLTKTKDSNITQEASNKRKREANVWSSHAGHTECSPLEIDANINSDSSLSSSKLRGSFKFSVEDHLRLAKVLVDEMYQFCALLDDNGHVLLANTPSLRGAGLRQEDIAGVPLWETRWWQVSPEHQARIRQSIKEVKSGKFIRFETLVYGQADGRSTIWIDFSMSAVYEDHNNERVLRYILVEGRNISDKKKAEEAVERKNEELRRLYEKVTELDELKSQFFANVSHELRTPLTLILGPVQRMLADGNLPERDLKDLEVVKRNTQTLLKHVNDLLDVSKIEAKKLEMNVERIDLEKLLKLVCSNFDALAQERNIQYTVNCTNPINLGNFLVELDSDKVQRIVLNLLSNAFKFTPVGGIINVQLLVEKRNDKMIAKLIMSDNGPGVPANLRKIIFERFRQGEGATNRKFGGTGLGLAIAKEFVEMHQGDIFVEESEFRGAKFVVELPMIQANLEVAKQQVPVKLSETMTANTIADLTGNMMTADKVQNLSNNILLAAQPSPMVVENSNSTPSLHQATILVVEDNIDMGNFISDSLSSNYRIMRAYNGVQGLEVISQRKPDIILSDVMMPYMSGDVMVQHIRSQRELDAIPIILLTAKADDNLKVHSLKGGVQDFLNKPFSIEELKARVENLVSVKLAVEALQSDLESKERNLVELTNQLLAKRRELQKMLEVAEKARAEAERLNTVKDEFLMTLSHELRTPLTGIIGWVSLIKDEITSDEMDANEVKRGLEIIEQCSEAETRVITDILDLSDIIAGRLKLTRNSINVGQLVDSGLDALTVAACAKNINIRKYDTPNFRSDLALMGDFDRLTQVVYNLVSNAVKFTPQGGHIEVGAEYCSDIHVTPSPTLVSTHKTSIEGPAVVIRVKDDGVGISQENLDKLFCRFGQLDSSSTRTYSGLGLGLALCRHIVELHGGFITVQSSSPTAGTVVSVYFPLAPVSSAAPVVELRSKTLQAARSAKILNGMKCLVVEPEKPSQLLLETIFRRDGASVECVNGTENALNVVNMTGMPNLVIINVDKVPKEDTLWLMKTLRVMKSGIAFLGLVSEFHSQEMQELIKAGIDFLRKPFKPYEVVSTAVFILSRVPKLQ